MSEKSSPQNGRTTELSEMQLVEHLRKLWGNQFHPDMMWTIDVPLARAGLTPSQIWDYKNRLRIEAILEQVEEE